MYKRLVRSGGRLLTATASLSVFLLPAGIALAAGDANVPTCANEGLPSFRGYLPDCRAYEMVSPPYKNDNGISPFKVRASVSGEAVTYSSPGSFGEPKAALIYSQYLSQRGAEGWSTKNITPPHQPAEIAGFVPFEELFFTPDLSRGLVRSEGTPLTSGSPPGYTNLYIADTSSGSYQAVTGPPPGTTPYEFSIEPSSAGVSTDLGHVVFQEYSSEAGGLTPEASPKHTHVYEQAAGHLSLVDIPPEGKTLEDEDEVGAPSLGRPSFGDVWHAVSADGSRVFFTGGEGESGSGEAGQVYVREVSQVRTVEVSASQKTNGSGPNGTDPNGLKPARYWDASADGSRVFFTSRSELTDNANTGSADNAANLYEYDLETGVLSDLTVDTNVGDVNGASVLGLVTAGEDGSYVYFVASGNLAEGAASGRPNLYLHHAGKVTFIATLTPGTPRNEEGNESGGDSEDWSGAEQGSSASGPGSHTVRVTQDGTHLAFESEASLTGYDNELTEPNEECGTGKCSEVYLYDATKTSLVCASCDPSGARPVGPARFSNNRARAGSPFYVPRNFSEDGGRLFFESSDPLVPHDSNGRVDVYEYENGHVYPISDVAGGYESYFLDASASGNDVFIATADQLVSSDTDLRIDVYDVKVGGGLPVSVAPSECTNSDSCKAPVASQPGVFGAPASATFSGTGNVPPGSAVKSTTKAKAKPKQKQCKGNGSRTGDKHRSCLKHKTRKSGGHSKKRRK